MIGGDFAAVVERGLLAVAGVILGLFLFGPLKIIVVATHACIFILPFLSSVPRLTNILGSFEKASSLAYLAHALGLEGSD